MIVFNLIVNNVTTKENFRVQFHHKRRVRIILTEREINGVWVESLEEIFGYRKNFEND